MTQQSQISVNIRVAPLDDGIYLFAQTKGTTKQRRRQVPGIINPDFTTWDRKKQMFMAPTTAAIANNAAIATFRTGFELINNNFHPATCDELIMLYDNSLVIKNDASVVVKKMTTGDFINQIITEQKTCTKHFIQKPSSTYQLYLNLLHKLEMEGNIINVPVDELSVEHVNGFSEFVLSELNGVNYKYLMKLFISVCNKAVEQHRNHNVFKFSIAKHAPKREAKRIRALSQEQLALFETYDLSRLVEGSAPRKTVEAYELYRDFALFLYEMKMRPIDVAKLNYTHIYMSDHNELYIDYVPEKKKNLGLPSTQCPLSEKAVSIIRKYKGQSSKGYVFPFALNEYDWDYNNPESYRKHYRKWNRVLFQINTFLSKMEAPLGFPDLTLYIFRHAAFTISCKEMKDSVFVIAKQGGTSVEMLEKHYFSSGFNPTARCNMDMI